MKKILLFAGIITCIFFSAQQTNFSKNYSTTKLKELKKNVPSSARHAFYIQYLKAKIFEDMKSKFNYKKYDDQVLKDFTDSIFSDFTSVETKSDVKILNKLDIEFKKDVGSEKFSSLLKKNLDLDPYVSFPYVSAKADEFAIFETLPGSVLSYYYANGLGEFTRIPSFVIIGKKIKLIDVYPDDSSFYNKIAKYASQEWKFDERAGYDISKNINGQYLISTQIYTDGESYLIEYQTKDFENFVPLRIAVNDEKPVWKVIK